MCFSFTISRHGVQLHLNCSPRHVFSCTTPFRSPLFKCQPLQSSPCLSQLSLFSSFSPSFEQLMAISCESHLSLYEQLCSPSQPETPRPDSASPLTQLSHCAQRRRALGPARASTPRKSSAAALSRRATHPPSFYASAFALFSSLKLSPHENAASPCDFWPHYTTPPASMSSALLCQPVFQKGLGHVSRLIFWQKREAALTDALDQHKESQTTFKRI